ncbi:MAG: N-acetylneuraminate lyase [Oscillospiraceae bacterium]|nr:N-acetylneuraminate lyase [Oscillospiraceae bacterium]
MDRKLTGIMPALMTAFDDTTGGISRDKTAALVKKLKAAGVHGLYVGGSSGEMVFCSVEQRMELLETVMEACGDLCVIAHTGAMTTADALRLSHHAESVGAHAISSVTPLYYKYSFREIKQYYARLCEAVSIPVILYNIPALTGTTLNADELSDLLSMDGIGGMKFTSSDFFLLNRLKQMFPDKVFYNGCDEMLLSGLSAGADGGIGTTYNFMPELMLSIYRLFREGRMGEAYAAQSLANQIIAQVVPKGVLPACKQMICFSGLDYGVCREPILPLEETAKQELYEKAWKPVENYIKHMA